MKVSLLLRVAIPLLGEVARLRVRGFASVLLSLARTLMIIGVSSSVMVVSSTAVDAELIMKAGAPGSLICPLTVKSSSPR